MIRDKYTYAPISRQRKYQLRKRDAGKCIICSANRVNSHYCEKHAEKARLMARQQYHKEKDVSD